MQTVESTTNIKKEGEEEKRGERDQSMQVCRGDGAREKEIERESYGSRQWGKAAQEREGSVRESVCEWEGGVSKHALHVIQSVHMALYYAVINT